MKKRNLAIADLFDIAPVMKLVSVTWLFGHCRSFRRLTLHWGFHRIAFTLSSCCCKMPVDSVSFVYANMYNLLGRLILLPLLYYRRQFTGTSPNPGSPMVGLVFYSQIETLQGGLPPHTTDTTEFGHLHAL